MNRIKIDLFKIVLVAILLEFLFLFYQYSQNGRFYLTNDGNLIIDSRTGTVWSIEDNGSRGNNAELYNNALQK